MGRPSPLYTIDIAFALGSLAGNIMDWQISVPLMFLSLSDIFLVVSLWHYGYFHWGEHFKRLNLREKI